MRRDDFIYELPDELIAQNPLSERSASRLLVLDDESDGAQDRSIRDLPSLLHAGDLLVFNDTRVVAARVAGTKPSGGRVEIFLERALEGSRALVQLRASKPVREGLQVRTAGGIVRVLGRQEEDLWLIETPEAAVSAASRGQDAASRGPPSPDVPVVPAAAGKGDRPAGDTGLVQDEAGSQSALEFFERWGEVPLPPYIKRPADAADRDRYQSIFARQRGAVAAPTASLHFDPGLVAAIEARGVGLAFVTLHVGAGTFQPVRTEDLESHTMHAERVSVSAQACAAIANTHSSGGRVIAVGTTVVRALESAALQFPDALPGAGRVPLRPWTGESRLFIRPGFRFQVIDALLTNFHLPGSTLLMLVCALAGRTRVLAAYEHAVRARYRFFSYGDAMFVTVRK